MFLPGERFLSLGCNLWTNEIRSYTYSYAPETGGDRAEPVTASFEEVSNPLRSDKSSLMTVEKSDDGVSRPSQCSLMSVRCRRMPRHLSQQHVRSPEYEILVRAA
eukprot:scaffold364618_cov51-Prasinocladus_malaysianus.AAC.1